MSALDLRAGSGNAGSAGALITVFAVVAARGHICLRKPGHMDVDCIGVLSREGAAYLDPKGLLHWLRFQLSTATGADARADWLLGEQSAQGYARGYSEAVRADPRPLSLWGYGC
jgi:hypothetical protein